MAPRHLSTIIGVFVDDQFVFKFQTLRFSTNTLSIQNSFLVPWKTRRALPWMRWRRL